MKAYTLTLAMIIALFSFVAFGAEENFQTVPNLKLNKGEGLGKLAGHVSGNAGNAEWIPFFDEQGREYSKKLGNQHLAHPGVYSTRIRRSRILPGVLASIQQTAKQVQKPAQVAQQAEVKIESVTIRTPESFTLAAGVFMTTMCGILLGLSMLCIFVTVRVNHLAYEVHRQNTLLLTTHDTPKREEEVPQLQILTALVEELLYKVNALQTSSARSPETIQVVAAPLRSKDKVRPKDPKISEAKEIMKSVFPTYHIQLPVTRTGNEYTFVHVFDEDSEAQDFLNLVQSREEAFRTQYPRFQYRANKIETSQHVRIRTVLEETSGIFAIERPSAIAVGA